jgi:hypothetical protein
MNTTFINNKKSQAAMEFLMSYGWALLVVLLVIAALAYFGMLNPDRFLPDKFELPTGISVRDVTFYDSFVVAMVSNGLGKTIYDLQLNLTACGTSGKISPPLTLAEGESKNIYVSCLHGKMTPLLKSKFKSNIIVNYTTQTYGDFITHKGQGYTRFLVSHDPGMIGYWPLDADGKDYSGNNYDGVCSGSYCPTATVGKVNGALTFGSSKNITVSGFNLGNTMSFSVWLQSSNYDGGIPISFDGDLNPPISGPNLVFTSTEIAWNNGNGNTNHFTNANPPPTYLGYPDANWHHFVVTNDPVSNQAKLYYDGAYAGYAAYSSALMTGRILRIGAFHTHSGDWGHYSFEGSIDEFAVFNRILKEDEIKALYLAGR